MKGTSEKRSGVEFVLLAYLGCNFDGTTRQGSAVQRVIAVTIALARFWRSADTDTTSGTRQKDADIYTIILPPHYNPQRIKSHDIRINVDNCLFKTSTAHFLDAQR